MDGKSAQFTKKSGPWRMVCGADQTSPASTENRSAWPESAGSIQLRYTRPSGATARLGSALPGPAGLVRRSIASTGVEMSADEGRLTRRNIAPMIAIAATTKSRIGRGTEGLRKVESIDS